VKLLFAIRDAHGWAGTERVLNLVANALAGNLDVEILSLSQRPTSERGYHYRQDVKISYLPVLGGALGVIAANLRAAAFIEKGDYDIAVLAGVGEIKYFMLAALRHSAKLVAWEHFNAAYTHKRFNRKFAARFCDAIIALTSQDAGDWRRLLHPKARVIQIPNPVPRFPERVSSLSTRRILALGRLEEQKRFDLLIDAFAIFHKTHPEWSLRIRGSGSMGEKLALKSAELGLQNHMEILEPTTDVAAEYQNASIYAMSSKFEGFPMTLLEAMASGVPCVSFACPNGPSEMIKDGEDGYLVQPGDVAALADRLGGLADDAALRARMGAAARENIKRYDIVMITKHWDDVLGEIAQ